MFNRGMSLPLRMKILENR